MQHTLRHAHAVGGHGMTVGCWELGYLRGFRKLFTHRMAIIWVRPQGSKMEGTSSASAPAVDEVAQRLVVAEPAARGARVRARQLARQRVELVLGRSRARAHRASGPERCAHQAGVSFVMKIVTIILQVWEHRR